MDFVILFKCNDSVLFMKKTKVNKIFEYYCHGSIAHRCIIIAYYCILSFFRAFSFSHFFDFQSGEERRNGR